MIKSICVKAVLTVSGQVHMVHTVPGDGATLQAWGQGDTIVISTSSPVSANGDNLILGG